MSEDGERIETPSFRRRGTVDYMRSASRRSNVHGLVEFDVTEAKAKIRATDGAPSARFIQTLGDRIEEAHGLDAPFSGANET